MPKNVMIDEFHLQVFIPHRLDDAAAEAIHRTLNSRRSQVTLRQAIQRLCARYRALAQAHLDRFLQMYAVEKAKLEARKKGFTVNEQALQDGSIKLQIIEGAAA